MSLKKNYLFIDESGDATFYAKRKKLLIGQEGFQPMLNLGLVTLEDKKNIRKAVVDFQHEIHADPLYSGIYSVKRPNWYLHARGDAPEIRAKFIELIRMLPGYEIYVVIGRKRLKTFENKHNSNEKEFYFDLVYHLLNGLFKDEYTDYRVFLSARESSTQHHLARVIDRAIERDNRDLEKPWKITYQHDIVRSEDTPELSIIDYYLWALQRYILKGEERFYESLKHRYTFILDLYNENAATSQFDQHNLFTKEKVEEFRNDGYL